MNSSGKKREKGIRKSDYRTLSRNFSVQKNKKCEIKEFLKKERFQHDYTPLEIIQKKETVVSDKGCLLV